MRKRAVTRLCQPVQPFAPVDAGRRHRRAAGLCGHRHGTVAMRSRRPGTRKPCAALLAFHIIECCAGLAAQPQRQQLAAIIQPVHNLVYP